MSDARNPLVVVLDDTVGELAEDTLLSALTSYNLLFTDEALVMDEIQASGIRNAVFSMNTVADQALIEAQNFWDIARVNIVTVAVSCMVIIMCAIQSVRIWSAQNKKMIFLLRSRGESYVGILQRRLLSELMLVLLIAIAVYFYLPMWQTIEHGLLISVIAVFVYLAIEFFASLTQTHSTFTKMVLRR